MLTRAKCQERNCIYDDENLSYESKVPKCYFDRLNLGYRLIKADNVEFHLQQKGAAPFLGVIRNLKLKVEYLGPSIIHVKVSEYLKEISLLY